MVNRSKHCMKKRIIDRDGNKEAPSASPMSSFCWLGALHS